MINEYNNLIQKIVKEFSKRYYKELFNEDDPDYRLINYQGINQGPVEVGGEFYSIDDILMTIKYDIPLKIVQKHYDLGYEASLNNKPLGINLYNFWRREKDNHKYYEDEFESLKESEAKVEEAKKILEEALK